MPKTNGRKKIIMVLGSSGGHIYPALAVAENLKARNLDVELIAPGTSTDKKILQAQNFKTHYMFMGRLNGVSRSEQLTSLLRLPWLVLRVWFFALWHRPLCVVGFGGALSGVFLLGAFLAGRKTFLFEPNACAGLANRWAGRFVKQAWVVMPSAARDFKRSVQVRMPVRSSLGQIKSIDFKLAIPAKPTSPAQPIASSQQRGVNDWVPTKKKQATRQSAAYLSADTTASPNSGATKFLKILVLGGSQGSSFINQVVLETVQLAVAQIEAQAAQSSQLPNESSKNSQEATGERCTKKLWFKKAFIRHQTGHRDFENLKQGYQKLNLSSRFNCDLKPVEVFEYLDPIAPHYEWANLVITRSGMGVLAELSLVGRPAVLIPLATAADNHQQLNAEQVVQKKAAHMILQKNLTPRVLQEQLNELAENLEALTSMAQNIKGLYTGPCEKGEPCDENLKAQAPRSVTQQLINESFNKI